jgi:cyclopropane fatty-acyl-phospholipid synthase-like methyltransferase
MQFLVPSGQRVLELGCGEGQLLRSLQPSHGVGVDLSQENDQPGAEARAGVRVPHRKC